MIPHWHHYSYSHFDGLVSCDVHHLSLRQLRHVAESPTIHRVICNKYSTWYLQIGVYSKGKISVKKDEVIVEVNLIVVNFFLPLSIWSNGITSIPDNDSGPNEKQNFSIRQSLEPGSNRWQAGTFIYLPLNYGHHT